MYGLVILIIGVITSIIPIIRYNSIHNKLMESIISSKDYDSIWIRHDKAQKILSIHAGFAFVGLGLVLVGIILLLGELR